MVGTAEILTEAEVVPGAPFASLTVKTTNH